MFSLIQKSGAFSKRTGSHFALAIALATGTAIAVSAVASPAQARDDEEKPDYSKGFVEAYRPVQELVNAEPADQAAIAAALPSVIAAAETPDDRNVAGNLTYGVGRNTDNIALQIQGLDLMINSGKGGPQRVGQLYYTQYQITRDTDDIAAARAALEGAIAVDYSFDGTLSDGTEKRFVADDLRLMIAELYFANDDTAAGLAIVDEFSAVKIAAGETLPRGWIRRSLAQAYNNDLAPEAIRYSALYVENYPGEESWADAINIQRNLASLPKGEVLDLLRLARRVGGLNSAQDYEEYVEAADARLLPGEVDAVIKEAQANGLLDGQNMFISEAREAASQLIAEDRSGLPALERDALASGANLRTIVAAGDVFLSYGQYGKAEDFYLLALQKPGVDANEVNNRLGIAQIEQENYSDGTVTLAKVQGSRQAIARLWSIYAAQQAGNSAAAEVAEPPEAPEAMTPEG